MPPLGSANVHQRETHQSLQGCEGVVLGIPANPTTEERIWADRMGRDIKKALVLLPDASDKDSDVVYIAQSVSGGPVKIGHTQWESRERRLAALQTGNPEKLVFRRVIAGGYWLERTLHELFASARLEGEWFGLCEEMGELCPEAFIGT